jgi:AraC-like DNA-binding protein
LIVATQKNRCPSIEGSGEFRGDLSPLLHERPTNRGIIAAIMAGAYRKLTRMTDPDSSATVRYSTADLPENMRIATWREHYGHTVLRAHIEPNVDSFGVTLDLRNLPGLKLVWGKFTSARIIRTREMIADGNDDLYLFVNQTGHITVSARGRDVTLFENDAVLISSGEAVVFDRHSSVGESITTRIPYSMLSPMVVDVDDAIMHRMPSNTAALKLLTSYASALLGEDHALTTPAHRHRVATHVHDLAALALGATREAADVAQGRGIRAARLRAAKTHIIGNISCRDMSIGIVASYLGVTPRYLQRLFESDGTTFSEFLLGQRLARAYRMLCEPQSAQRQVSAIAYDVGFSDLSYFNRCFRRHYGATPTDMRKAAGN